MTTTTKQPSWHVYTVILPVTGQPNDNQLTADQVLQAPTFANGKLSKAELVWNYFKSALSLLMLPIYALSIKYIPPSYQNTADYNPWEFVKEKFLAIRNGRGRLLPAGKMIQGERIFVKEYIDTNYIDITDDYENEKLTKAAFDIQTRLMQQQATALTASNTIGFIVTSEKLITTNFKNATNTFNTTHQTYFFYNKKEAEYCANNPPQINLTQEASFLKKANTAKQPNLTLSPAGLLKKIGGVFNRAKATIIKFAITAVTTILLGAPGISAASDAFTVPEQAPGSMAFINSILTKDSNTKDIKIEKTAQRNGKDDDVQENPQPKVPQVPEDSIMRNDNEDESKLKDDSDDSIDELVKTDSSNSFTKYGSRTAAMQAYQKRFFTNPPKIRLQGISDMITAEQADLRSNHFDYR